MSCKNKNKNTIVECVLKYVRSCNKDCLKIRFIISTGVIVSFKIDKLIHSNDNYNLSNTDYLISIEPKKYSEYVW
jgi:hypothetical protein